MFTNEYVPVQLRKLALKIEIGDDNGDPVTRRICESTFRIPTLKYELASQVQLPIVAYCYGKDRLPLWGVHDVQFQPPAEPYAIALAAAVDAAPIAVLMFAEVIKVRVWRPNREKRDLALEFTTRHELERGDARDLAQLLAAWEVCDLRATLETVQIPLSLVGGDEAENDPARGGAGA